MVLFPSGKLTALAQGIATTPAPSPKTLNGIEWYPCEQNFSQPISCGTLAVPLDYTSNSSETIDLDIIKINATKTPVKGSILFNPGGPGEPGRPFVASFAQPLLV